MTRCCSQSNRGPALRWLFLLIALPILLLTGLSAQATNYTFPGTANTSTTTIGSGTWPLGCSGTSGTYSCSILTLAAGDNITITSRVTLNFTGALTTGAGVSINSGGTAANLTLNVTGALNLGANTRLNANITGQGAITINAGSLVDGTITTPGAVHLTGTAGQITGSINTATGTGPVTIDGGNTIGGAITSATGAVTIGATSRVGGTITTSTGAITLNDGTQATFTQVDGAINSASGTISIGNYGMVGIDNAATIFVGSSISTVTGTIGVGDRSKVGPTSSSTNGVITIGKGVLVSGSVSTATDGINIGDGSNVVGSISSSVAGVINVGAGTAISGSISTATGAINIEHDTTIIGSVSSTVAGVITLTTNINVGGDINNTAGAVNVGDQSKICGNIMITGAGVVTLTTRVQVGGNIGTSAGAVTISDGSMIGGDIILTGAGAVTLTSVQVGGRVTAAVGAITLTSSRVKGTVTGNAAITLTSSVVQDPTLSMSLVCTAKTPCIVDPFSGSTLNTTLWTPLAVSGNYTPAVVNHRIQMTTANGNQSTMLQLKKWFPGAGNKMVVEFDYYVYAGDGADGIAVVFSDASIAPAPGGFGGSLGYAQRNDPKNGFSGGWLAVGIDEFGNFPNATEGRNGYPTGWTKPAIADKTAGFYNNNISVRGSGSGTTGYRLLANTGTLSSPIWKSSNTLSTRQHFRITIDHSDNTHAYVTVERDMSTTGSNYVTLVPTFDAMANSGQAPVPVNWTVSFTGSTGGSTNIHEIAQLSICAPLIKEPDPSYITAGAFECLETGTNANWNAAARKPLYTKLVNTDFKFDIAALKTDGTLESNYITSGGASKYVKVELFDDTTPATSCSAYSSAVASQIVTFASSAAGRTLTNSNFKLASVYKNLLCRVKECASSTGISCTSFSSVAPACSSDRFSVRPSAATLIVTPTMAAAPSATATPVIKAGANFTLRATANSATVYSGTLTLDASKLSAQITDQDTIPVSGGAVGTLTPATLTANAAAVNATYGEVGYLSLAPGAYRDDAFTAVDSADKDCVINNMSDTLIEGKYGCSIGNNATVTLGRFIPDHFAIVNPTIVNRTDLGTSGATSAFTYMGEPMSANFTLVAQNATGATTLNYNGPFAKLKPAIPMVVGTSGILGLGAIDTSALRTPFPACGATPAPPCITPGTATGAFLNGSTDIILPMTVLRGATAVGPYPSFNLGINPVDADLVAMGVLNLDTVNVVAGANNHARIGSAVMRYGRINIDNAYGSELLNLWVKMTAQYWNGTAYVTNVLDNSTLLPAANFAMSNWSGDRAGPIVNGQPTVKVGVNATNMDITHFKSSGATIAGIGNIMLTKPTPSPTTKGSVTLYTPSSSSLFPYLPGSGRVTFGVYKSGPIIFIREMY